MTQAQGQGQFQPGEPARRMSAPVRLGLILGLVFVLLVVLGGVIVAATNIRVGTVDLAADAAAGSRVTVDIPDAALEFQPGGDDQVHVRATGRYLGAQPRLTATTVDGVTTVTGGCPDQWFGFCQLDVAVTLPASLPVTAQSTNGRITASGLTGPLRLATTNGAITASGTRDRIDLHTTNGAITVRDSSSREASATTTNGSVDLVFLDPPRNVEARSTNGSVTVRVPDDGAAYRVQARTTNGDVDTGSVRADPAALRSIVAETTNGKVIIEAR